MTSSSSPTAGRPGLVGEYPQAVQQPGGKIALRERGGHAHHRELASTLGEPAGGFLTSGDLTTFRTLGARFLGPEVETVEAWEWS